MDYKHNIYTEEELIEGIKQKDATAFSYLYDHYAGTLFESITHIIKDENKAADILQNVFVKIYLNILSYDARKGRLFTWMINIARNEYFDTLRSKAYSKSKQTSHIDDLLCKELINPYKKMDAMDVRKTVFKLSPDLRYLIELSFYYGFSQQEIALLLHMPVGTVKTKIRKAYQCLRVLLQED